MAKKETVGSKVGEYICPSVMDIAVAGEFGNNLKSLTDSDGDITLEASEVNRITTPCVQVILGLAKMLKDSGRKLIINNPSEDFCKVFVDLGLAYELESWNLNNCGVENG